MSSRFLIAQPPTVDSLLECKRGLKRELKRENKRVLKRGDV